MLRTLTSKVACAALTFLTLTATIGAIAIASISSVSRSTEHLTNSVATQAYLSGQFEAGIFHIIDEASFYVQTRDTKFRDEAYVYLEKLDERVAGLETLERADDAAHGPNESHAWLIEQRHSLVGELRQAIDRLFIAVAVGDEVAIRRHFVALRAPEAQMEALSHEIDQLLDHHKIATNRVVQVLSQRSIYSVAMSFSLFALMVMFALILLRRQIVRPIKQLSITAGIVARGDLSRMTPITNADEIGDLQQSFNQMIGSLREQRAVAEQRAAAEQGRAEAEQANRAKSAFLAHMSHELRTPLTAIIGYSDLLLNIITEPSQQALLPDIQKIHQAGQHLLALIDDVLDLSKIEAGQFQLELAPLDIRALMDEMTTTVQALIAKNGNTLDVRCPNGIGVMHADATKVRQMLLNLLSNAAKFTDHGSVTLSVQRVAGLDGEQIRFQVADTGIGISAEQLTKLFQPFTQATTTTSRLYGGTGLGLAISQRLAHTMDGDITVESELGRGTVFSVLLPSHVTPSVGIAAHTAPLPASSFAAKVAVYNGLVLVIDDDPSVRELITCALEGEQLTVVTASGGQEGLKLARALLPDVIILDLLMSDMDGWSVLGALKADSDLAPIPVIMQTIIDERETGFALGVSHSLIKRVERALLVTLTRKYQSSIVL
jgi:signal transduction histidine kinase